MLKIFSNFILEFTTASKNDRAYVYIRFHNQMPFYLALYDRTDFFEMAESINSFVKEYNKANIWNNKEKIAYKYLQDYIGKTLIEILKVK